MPRIPRKFADITAATKGWLLGFLALPAVPAALIALARDNLPGVLVNAGGFALCVFAALLLRRGVREERAYRERRFANPPAPLKTLAALLIGLTTTGFAWLGAAHGAAVAAVFGCGALLGMYLSYGFDPRVPRKPLLPASLGVDVDEVLRAVEAAEARIALIDRDSRHIRNPEFKARLSRICEIARAIVAEIAEDPRDFRRARKFLNVYLDGVEKVVAGYSRTHVRMPSAQLEVNFRNVLAAIEDTFLEQRERLLENDVFDLDVQIEVLATQLKREGIT